MAETRLLAAMVFRIEPKQQWLMSAYCRDRHCRSYLRGIRNYVLHLSESWHTPRCSWTECTETRFSVMAGWQRRTSEMNSRVSHNVKQSTNRDILITFSLFVSRILRCLPVCCIVWQCVAVYSSVLQNVAV